MAKTLISKALKAKRRLDTSPAAKAEGDRIRAFKVRNPGREEKSLKKEPLTPVKVANPRKGQAAKDIPKLAPTSKSLGKLARRVSMSEEDYLNYTADTGRLSALEKHAPKAAKKEGTQMIRDLEKRRRAQQAEPVSGGKGRRRKRRE